MTHPAPRATILKKNRFRRRWVASTSTMADLLGEQDCEAVRARGWHAMAQSSCVQASIRCSYLSEGMICSHIYSNTLH
jgi:hypothetical protein